MTETATDAAAWWRDPALGERRDLSLPADVFEAGTGAPIVFVHGLLANANLWRLVVPRLRDDFHCVTVDLPFGAHVRSVPGADLSPPGLAAILADVIEALSVGPVTLVGNDSGGAVCQILVTTRPDLVARLVLTSCDAYDNFPPKMFGYLKVAERIPGSFPLLLGPLRWLPALRRLPMAFGWLSVRPLPRAVSDSYLLPACVGRDIRADLHRIVRGVGPRHTLQAAEGFRRFQRPVLIAWSERDRFFPRAHAERLARDFPDARIHWIPRARTFSPEDQPELLAAAIADFARHPVADPR